jgi:hypothetical protein
MTSPETDNKITVWPNPFKGNIAVSCPALAGSAISKRTVPIKIYNIHGKLIRDLTANSKKLKAGLALNTADLASGIYLIKLTAGKKKLVKRVTLIK